MDAKSDQGATEELTVESLANKVRKLGAGRFTSTYKRIERLVLASRFGSPCFALQHYHPALLANPTLRVLIGNADHLVRDNGRWLTLYSRALAYKGKLSYTLCVDKRQHAAERIEKEVQVLPHHRIEREPWHHHLANSPDKYDAIILFHLETLSGLEKSIRRSLTLLPGQDLLIGSTSFQDAVLIQQLLRIYDLPYSRVTNFPLKGEEPQNHAIGGWWIKTTIPLQPGPALKGDPEFMAVANWITRYIEAIYLMGMEEPNAIDIDLFFRVFGRRIETVDPTGHRFTSLCVGGLYGFDLSSGRAFRFERSAVHDYPIATWMDETLPRDLMGELPVHDPDACPDEMVFRDLRWLQKAIWAYHKLLDPDSELPEHINSPVQAQHEATVPIPLLELAGPDTTAKAKTSPLPEKTGPIIYRIPRLSLEAGKIDVLALAGVLGNAAATSDAYTLTRDQILHWLGRKGFRLTSPDANANHETADGELSIETDGNNAWAMRFDDRRSMDQGIIWRVEVTLIRSDSTAMGLRLSQVRPSTDSPSPASSGVPAFVSAIAKVVGLSDAGVPFHSEAYALTGEKGAQVLMNLLINSARVQPVVVFQCHDAEAMVKGIDTLARRLIGVAHVVRLDDDGQARFKELVGPALSVRKQSVRLYRPGFSIESDAADHPVWPAPVNQLPRPFLDELFEVAAAVSLEYDDLDERVPSFPAVRDALSEQRVLGLTQEAASLALSEQERNAKLDSLRKELEAAVADHKEQIQDLRQRNTHLAAEIAALRVERDHALDEVRRLNRTLNIRFGVFDADEEDPDDGDETEVDYPDNWGELQSWVDRHGHGRIILHHKAIKAAMSSPFRDIPLAYKALDYLARFYVPMRYRDVTDGELYESAKAFLLTHALEDSGVGTADGINRYKRFYQRIHDGKTITLDRHLKKGGSFDPATCFRLYYCYDEEAQVAIVGHMPGHLVNRLTH